MTGEAVSIRLEPAASSVAMSRIFLGSVLSSAGVDEDRIEDAQVLISDLATALVGDGEPVLIDVRFGKAEVRVEGNLPGMVPEAGSLLLGDALAMGDGHWTLTLPAS